LRRDRWELFLGSFLMLFVELALIRWAGAWVVYLSYFANFVLLGSFLGIGLGFLRARKGPDLFRAAPILLALMLALLVAFPSRIDRTGGDLVYFGVQQRGLPVWVVLPFVFLATALTMASIAHGVATRFARFEALEAYRLDILGSIAGTVTFAALALAGIGPIGWGVVIVGLFVALLRPAPTLVQGTALVAMLAVFTIGTVEHGITWSPYYRLTVLHAGHITAVDANGVPHQAAIPTTGTDYEIPYRRLASTPSSVLVIGAGNGNDVATALREGASSVDAVEIDPKLLAVGVAFHPDHPYQDPRVRRIVSDGRAYLERTDARYDLIVFALPDSLTLLGNQSSLRLESYLFTREAFEAARDHLTPGGAFAMYNFYRQRWLADRLAGTLRDVFGQAPCFDLGNAVAGTVGRQSYYVDSVDPSALRCDHAWDPAGRDVVPPAVDDRPFPYLRTRTIPARYLVTLALILLASLVLVRGTAGPIGAMRSYADLAFMGAAFLLLETKSVVQFALLFGTTWFVNALVFCGVLLSVLAAIEVERRIRFARPRLLLGLLALGLVVAWLVPTDALLGLSFAPRFVAAVALSFFPIFVANLIFAVRFRDATEPAAAFGANLLGAIVGGTLEYLALLTGYRSLLIVVGLLYGLAYLLSPSRGRETGPAEASVPVPVGAGRPA
jgi:hypothetical protein